MKRYGHEKPLRAQLAALAADSRAAAASALHACFKPDSDECPGASHVCDVCHAGLGLYIRAVRQAAAALRHADGAGAFSSGGSDRPDSSWCGMPSPDPVPSPLSPKYPSHSGRVGPAPGHWPRPARAATRARPSHPSHSVRVTPAPDPRKGRHESSEPRNGRPGPTHPSRRTRWGKLRRGARPAGVPAAPTASGATPRLSGPGRRPEHHRGRVYGRKIEFMATGRGVRSSPR